MPIDQKTDRFQLELPNEANTLKHDVARLIDSFNTLDDKAAKLDDDGHVSLDQLPDTIAKLTPAGFIKDEQIPPKIPLMDAKGKLSLANIPDQAQMEIKDAASEVLMLELDATLGDICNITTSPYKQFLLVKKDPKQRDSWRELPMKAVTSVNGNTGDVVVAAAGENNDITSLTALQGPLRLGGAAQSLDDAVTLRQLNDASGKGGNGATLTGVMNNFIGAIEWFNGDGARLPPGYIVASGQYLNQADYPDLWAAVQSGVLTSIDNNKWMNGTSGQSQGTQISSPYIYRGMYSKGGAAGTCPDKNIKGAWFRVPDLNGATHSLGGLFLRGALGKNTFAVPTGVVFDSSAPNITGKFVGGATNPDTAGLNTPTMKSFNVAVGDADKGNGRVAGEGDKNDIYTFNAKTSNAAYGRSESYFLNPNSGVGSMGWSTTDEVRPVCAHGYWLIRASGSFHAANTSFEVINGYNPMPGTGIAINGGTIQSSLRDDNGMTVNAAKMTVNNTVGGKPSARFSVGNWILNSTTQQYSLDWKEMNLAWLDGTLTCPGNIWSTPVPRLDSTGKSYLYGQVGLAAATEPNSIYLTNQVNGTVNRLKGEWYTSCWELFGVRDDSTGLKFTSWRLTPQSSNITHYYEIVLFADGHVTMPGAQQFNTNGSINLMSGTAHASLGPDGQLSGSIYGGFSTVVGWANAQFAPISDRRAKKNIKPVALDTAIDFVRNVPTYTYQHDIEMRETMNAGYLAQDVEAYFPEVINQEKIILTDGTVLKDGMGMDAGNLAAAALTPVVKMLLERVEALEAQLATKA